MGIWRYSFLWPQICSNKLWFMWWSEINCAQNSFLHTKLSVLKTGFWLFILGTILKFGGTTSKNGHGHIYKGLLYVYHNQDWGTVCDDDFDLKDATVACKYLGFKNAVQVSSSYKKLTGSQGRFFWPKRLLKKGFPSCPVGQTSGSMCMLQSILDINLLFIYCWVGWTQADSQSVQTSQILIFI